jgi:hypothetical protein
VDTTESPEGEWVRPFAVTGGRAIIEQDLLLETIISVPNGRRDDDFAASLDPETRAVYHQVSRMNLSLAELSAGLRLPLGVVRVLVDDLSRAGRVRVHPNVQGRERDPQVYLRVIKGLKRKLEEDRASHAI